MIAKRISDRVYAENEKYRHECECRHTAKRFYKDTEGLDEWILKVAAERGHEEAYRLKKCVVKLIG